jgi:hypothetical protein
MARKNETGDEVPGNEIQDTKQQVLSSTIPEDKKPNEAPTEQIKINPIFQMLMAMPAWKNLNIEIIDRDSYIIFRRKSITIHVPSMEILTFGAKTFYDMFALLDK